MKKALLVFLAIFLVMTLFAGTTVVAGGIAYSGTACVVNPNGSIRVANNGYFSQKTLTKFSQGQSASLTLSVTELGNTWYEGGLTLVVNSTLQDALPTTVWQETGAAGVFTYSFQANASNQMVGMIYRCGQGTGSTAAADWALASLAGDVTVEVKQNTAGVTALYLNGAEWVPHSSSGLAIPDGYLAIATSAGSEVAVKASQAAVDGNNSGSGSGSVEQPTASIVNRASYEGAVISTKAGGVHLTLPNSHPYKRLNSTKSYKLDSFNIKLTNIVTPRKTGNDDWASSRLALGFTKGSDGWAGGGFVITYNPYSGRFAIAVEGAAADCPEIAGFAPSGTTLDLRFKKVDNANWRVTANGQSFTVPNRYFTANGLNPKSAYVCFAGSRWEEWTGSGSDGTIRYTVAKMAYYVDTGDTSNTPGSTTEGDGTEDISDGIVNRAAYEGAVIDAQADGIHLTLPASHPYKRLNSANPYTLNGFHLTLKDIVTPRKTGNDDWTSSRLAVAFVKDPDGWAGGGFVLTYNPYSGRFAIAVEGATDCPEIATFVPAGNTLDLVITKVDEDNWLIKANETDVTVPSRYFAANGLNPEEAHVCFAGSRWEEWESGVDGTISYTVAEMEHEEIKLDTTTTVPTENDNDDGESIPVYYVIVIVLAVLLVAAISVVTIVLLKKKRGDTIVEAVETEEDTEAKDTEE